MPATPTADFSESFMHVTDHTAKLSSVGDFEPETTATLENLNELLRLANKHDKAAKESRLRQSKGAKNRDFGSQNGFRNLSSSAQSTPLNRPQVNKENLDAAGLFKLLQPYLESYLGEKPGTEPRAPKLSSIGEDPFTTPKRSVVLSESDSENNTRELEVHDTFDKRSRKSASPANLASSPATTPPLSREFVDLQLGGANEKTGAAGNSEDETGDAECDVDDSDMCKFLGKVPQLELVDLTEDEIKLEGAKSKAPDVNKVVTDLRLEMERIKQDNKELANEISYLRDKLAQKEASEKMEKLYEPRQSRPTTASSVGSYPINDETVEPCFRPYYSKLQLGKVDGLTEMEKSNVIKNLMLSLLVSDFDHLQQMAPRVGDYLRISSRFLDKLHSRFYGSGEYCPSRYLRDYALESMDDFQACLDGMMELIKQDVPELGERPQSQGI